MIGPIAFAGGLLDRADHLRGDAAALTVLAADPAARVLRLDGLDPVGQRGQLVWDPLPSNDVADLIFLGLEDGAGRFARVPDVSDTRPGSPRLWAMLAGMGRTDLAHYGMARALAGWHARHRFCAQCGGPTVLAKGGWQRDCTACAAQHFPRTDPVTIMLVEHDGRLLLGRQPRFPVRRYSALAGFVEPGETIEEAVAREVQEEAGIAVHQVSYLASQPWPFPSSLMIGCHAFALNDAITIDVTELDDARWFTRAEVAAAMAGGDNALFDAPPPHAIAHQLIAWWLARG